MDTFPPVLGRACSLQAWAIAKQLEVVLTHPEAKVELKAMLALAVQSGMDQQKRSPGIKDSLASLIEHADELSDKLRTLKRNQIED